MNSVSTLTNHKRTITFLGQTKFLSCDSKGYHKKVSDCPFGLSSFGDTRGLSRIIKLYTYPNAKIEETIGVLHDNKTNRVYIADPKEQINNALKYTHDYIVYDIEPSFPNLTDVTPEYFDNNEKNLGKIFTAISEYFKRLEKADTKRLSSNTEETLKYQERIQKSQHFQWLAEMCKNIYEEAGSLREELFNCQKLILIRKNLIQDILTDIPVFSKELQKKQNLIEKTSAKIKRLQNKLNQLKTSISNDDKTIEIQNLTDDINTLNNKLLKYTKRVTYLKDYIENSPNNIEKNNNIINNTEQKIIYLKQQLIAYYKKLNNFYKNQGIKIVIK